MKSIKFLVIFVLIYSCYPTRDSDCHGEVLFINNSDSDKFIIWTEKQVFGNECDNFLWGIAELGNPIKLLGSNNSCVENKINSSFNGAIVIYVFQQSPEIYECDLVAQSSDIIDIIEYNVEDLNALNFTIVYPQEEN